MVAGLAFYKASFWSSSDDWPLHPYCLEEAERHGPVDFSERGCRLMILSFVLEGDLVYRCDGGPECVVGAGGLFIIPQGSDYSFTTTPTRRYRKLVLEIKGLLLKSLSGMLGLDRPGLVLPPDPSAFEAEMRAFGPLMEAGREEDVPDLLGMTFRLISGISLSARALPDDLRLLARAKSLLEGRFDKASSISSLASELGVCHSLLDRLFKSKLGVTPQAYRIRRRMENASHLLACTSLPVKEVSARLGYASQLYFSNDFKKHFGLSPRAFRRKRSEIGPLKNALRD